MGRMAGGFVAAVLLSLTTVVSAAFNVTLLLSTHPTFSTLNDLLSSSGVASEINSRSSVTLLAPPNDVIAAFLSANPNPSPGEVADLLRYHCLLQYLDIPELQQITPGSPSTVTTLLQTTGRVQGNEGVVNINYDGTTIGVGLPDPAAPPNATIVNFVSQLPFNISILQVDKVLVPPGWGAQAADSANITAALEAAVNYRTFISLITITGVDAEFAAKQTGTGITIFAPTDLAFLSLPPGALSALTSDQAKQVLRTHAIDTYYPLGTLSTLNKTNEPTLATDTGGAGTFLLNISSSTSGGVVLTAGSSTATVGATIFDTNPTAIFSVDNVLLPDDLFAPEPAPAPVSPTPVLAPAPSTLTPAPAPEGPAPAPAPLTPVAVPASAPAPGVPTPAPVPSPDIAPGPPAPPEEAPIPVAPIASPTEAPPLPAAAAMTMMSRASLAAVLFFSGLMLL